MAARITDHVIDALQHCSLKAYLVLHGEQGVQTTYERLLIEQRSEAQCKAIEKTQYEYCEAEIASDINLSVVSLRKGAALVLNARLEDDRHAISFDGLRKVDRPSNLGNFCYEPVMFCATRRVVALDRRGLAARGSSGANSGYASWQRGCLSGA